MKTFTILAVAALATATAGPVSAGAADAAAPAQEAPRTGAMVRGADGSELGRLEARRTNADGEVEIVVRGADGRLRGIPAAAAMVHGDEIHVGWTMAQFQAAAEIASPGPGSPGSSGGDPRRATTGAQADAAANDTADAAGDATAVRRPDQMQAPESTGPQ